MARAIDTNLRPEGLSYKLVQAGPSA